MGQDRPTATREVFDSAVIVLNNETPLPVILYNLQIFVGDTETANILPNSADPDQTVLFKEQSGLDLRCLLRFVCPKS